MLLPPHTGFPDCSFPLPSKLLASNSCSACHDWFLVLPHPHSVLTTYCNNICELQVTPLGFKLNSTNSFAFSLLSSLFLDSLQTARLPPELQGWERGSVCVGKPLGLLLGGCLLALRGLLQFPSVRMQNYLERSHFFALGPLQQNVDTDWPFIKCVS